MMSRVWHVVGGGMACGWIELICKVSRGVEPVELNGG